MKMQTEETQKPIVFISTGPGHYSKLTLEALALLRWVDKIYCFASLEGEHYHSRTLDTLLEADKSIGQKCEIVDLPMDNDRTQALDAYQHLADKLAQEWKDGKYVAVCAEGATGIYASVRNLMLMLSAQQIPWVELPGIPSFVAGAALAGIGLCEQNTRMLVVPGDITTNEILEHLRNHTNLVIMKPTRCEKEIKAFIQNNACDFEFYYCENISCPGQRIVHEPCEILKIETFPYFSILIIRTR